MYPLIKKIESKIKHLEESSYVCAEYNLIINLLKECKEEIKKLENEKNRIK